MFNTTMKFDLGDDVNEMRDMVHRWAQERVTPMAAEIDTTTNSRPRSGKRWAALVCLA